MAKSVRCIVNNREVILTPGAYEMAKQYYGAVRLSDLIAAKPMELSKPLLIPKPLTKEIIPPVEKTVEKVVDKVVETPIVKKPVAKKRKSAKK